MMLSPLVVPPLSVPAGVTVRHYQKGDEAAWEAIVGDAFGKPYAFASLMEQDPRYTDESLLFACAQGIPISTAAAWSMKTKNGAVGYLTMVGVLNSHQGMGFGRLITLAALHYMKAQGYKAAVLNTEPHRLAAISLYHSMGFRGIEG